MVVNTNKNVVRTERAFGFAVLVSLLLNTTQLFDFWEKSGVIDEIKKPDIFHTMLGFILFAFFIWYIGVNRTKFKSIVKNYKLLLLFSILGLISFIWAIDPFLLCVRKWLREMILFTAFLAVLCSNRPSNLMQSVIFRYSIIVLVGSVVLIAFFPEYGWMQYEDGVLPIGIMAHKNSLGRIAGLLLFIIPILNVTPNFRFVKWTLFSGFLILLYQSHSVTSWGGVFTAYCVFLLYRILYSKCIEDKKNRDLRAAAIISCLFASCALLYILLNIELFSNPLVLLVNYLGKDLTFTGRTEIWSPLISFGYTHHFWLGAGYNGGTLQGLVPLTLDWQAYHAHNGFLQAFFELGIIGVSILFFIFVNIFKRITKSIDQYANAIYLLPLFFYILFNNLFEVFYQWNAIFFIMSGLLIAVKQPEKDQLVQI